MGDILRRWVKELNSGASGQSRLRGKGGTVPNLSSRVHFVNSAWYCADSRCSSRFRKALRRMTTTTPAQRPGIDIVQHGRVLIARLMGGPNGELGPEIAADL